MDYPGSLDLLAVGQAGKEETVNALFSAFSPAVGFGRRASTSAGLTWGYYGGVIAISDKPTVIANGTVTLTDDATCYIRLKDSDGTVDHVTSAPTDWPAPNGGYTALYEVTTASGACTAWTDYRIARGPRGATGATGAAGAAGATGAAGAAGGSLPGGRLTLTSGTPVTTADVTAATNIYYTPFRGDAITLWDGAAWTPITFTETTLALGTLTSGKNYDVFGYDNTGTLALEMLAWTNDTTRATAVTLQDGRYCKSGDKTRLYLGTFRTTSTTTTEDSGGGTTTQVGGKRFLWNYYNQVDRPLLLKDTTTYWLYTTRTIRQANGAAGNKVEYVCGMPESAMTASINVTVELLNNTLNADAAVGFGLDSTVAFHRQISTACHSGASAPSHYPLCAVFNGLPSLGYHYMAWLEIGAASNCYWIGSNAGGTAGIEGCIKG